jgi:hypothetical protein
MANQDDLGANPKIFELGKITLEGYPDVYVQEVSVNTTRELHQYYTTDSFVSKAVRPGRLKIDFTIRKAKETDSAVFQVLFESTIRFNMTLYSLNAGDEVDDPRELMTLVDCRLGRDNLGNFDTTKPVTEDIEGQARKRIMKT